MDRSVLTGAVAVGIVAIGAVLWFNNRPTVVTGANSGVIITGVVEKDSHIQVSTYDTDEERHRRVQTFAGSESHLCQQYLSEVSALTLEDAARSRSVPSFMFDGQSFEPELVEAMGLATYQKISSEQRHLRQVAGDLTQARQQYAVRQAFVRARGQPDADIQRISARIGDLRSQLITLTTAHCKLLSDMNR